MDKPSLVLLLFAFVAQPNLGLAQTPAQIPPQIATPEKVETRLGTLQFELGMPDDAAAAKLYDHLDSIHAEDAFLNAFAGVNAWALRKGFLDEGIKDNDVLIFSGLMDSKSLFLTANADTIYFWTFVDLSKGPMVVEIPPVVLAMADDMWWRYIADMGLAGPDRGVGGKYLLVPPGYKGPLPDQGYFVNHSRTMRVDLLGRAFLENNDPKPAVERIKKTMKIYPYASGLYGTSIGDILAGGAAPPQPWTAATWGATLQPIPAPNFVEGTGKVINTIPPNDYSYYEMLNEAVQDEPAEALDPEIAGSFAAIGIVKGKPFQPDGRMRKILTEAAALANATSRTVAFRPRLAENFNYYGESSQWINGLFDGGYEFITPPPRVTDHGIEQYATDGARKLNLRTWFFYSYTGITPAMSMRLTNIGSQYLLAYADKQSQALDGGKHYKITLPPNIPAARFWSFTVYDNQTRSMLDTPQRFPRAGSQTYPTPPAAPEADGSITVHFSPRRPDGVTEGNWIQTTPGKGWFVALRLYSPLQPFFDKTWRPGEVEEVK